MRTSQRSPRLFRNHEWFLCICCFLFTPFDPIFGSVVLSEMKATRIFAACLAGFFLASCERRVATADWWHGEQERIELSHRLELQQFRYDRLGRGDAEKYANLLRSNAEAAARVKELRDRQGKLAEEVRGLEEGWKNFRTTVLSERRQDALGAKFATFTVASGRSYEEVCVSSIDDAGVSIRHASGSARLRFADLSVEHQTFFGLEQDLASTALARESENARHYDQWVENGVEAQQAKEEWRVEIARNEEVAARKVRADFQASLLAASSQRALAQPARTFSSSRYDRNFYHSYSPYRNYTNYYYVAPSRCVTPYISRQALVDQWGAEFRRKMATFSGQ